MGEGRERKLKKFPIDKARVVIVLFYCVCVSPRSRNMAHGRSTMKTKSRLTLIILTLVAVLIAVALFGCTPAERKEGSAERIQIEDTHVFLAPEGEPSTYQLKPLVYPVETASQKVYYRLQDNTDREFLDVSADGVLQAHKLKQDEDGNNIDIIVRIISAENSDVTLEVKVTIEVVEVQKITFNPSVVNINVAGAGVDLEPIFTPAHAITGRNLIYTSLNKNVATVDSTGHVTPVSVGQCSIWVQTPKTGAFDVQVESHVTINVVYTSMATGYRLDLVSPESTLKQISGEAEGISFVLSQLDPLTDPNPNILWYINSTRIQEEGVKDSKVLTYVPSMLSPGEYTIRAILSNTFETTEAFVSDVIKIYTPLTSFNADIWNDDLSNLQVGNVLRMKATYGDNMYPPEFFIWTITTPSGQEEEISKMPSSDRNQPDFEYEFKEAGNYKIKGEAVIKGKPSGVFSQTREVYVGEKPPVNDISGVYFDGSVVDGELFSTMIWDVLPYEQDYQVEIKLGEAFFNKIEENYGVEVENGESTIRLSGASGYLGVNTLRIPNYIIDNVIGGERNPNDTMMNYSYSVKITGSKYESESDWYEYDGSIHAGVEYFEEILPGMNRYIANMEEYGKLLNYLFVFRPDSLASVLENYDFELNIFVPFDTSDLDRKVYPVKDNVDTSETNAAEIDAIKLFDAVINTYAESVSMGIDVINATLGGGATRIVININSQESPFISTEYQSGIDDEFAFAEAPSITHYATTPRGNGSALPIDSLTRTMEVATTNQLYLAVEMGYKPIPVVGSKAEEIWNAVREILCSIISDDMSVNAKALAIYEWLSVNVVYDYKIADMAEEGTLENAKAYNAFYLEGVFIDHVAVCDGIAKAFCLMAGAEGIPNFKVVGYASGVAHAWNMALLEEGWFVIDATWGAKKVVSDEQRLEVLNKDFFAIGKETASDSRTTYGKFPEINAEDSLYAYQIKISETYDSVINTDGEINYYVETYLFDCLDGQGEVWAEFVIDEEYFKGKNRDVSAIVELIQKAIRVEGVTVGCVSEVGASGLTKIYIHYTRS